MTKTLLLIVKDDTGVERIANAILVDCDRVEFREDDDTRGPGHFKGEDGTWRAPIAPVAKTGLNAAAGDNSKKGTK